MLVDILFYVIVLEWHSGYYLVFVWNTTSLGTLMVPIFYGLVICSIFCLFIFILFMIISDEPFPMIDWVTKFLRENYHVWILSHRYRWSLSTHGKIQGKFEYRWYYELGLILQLWWSLSSHKSYPHLSSNVKWRLDWC